MLAFACLSLRHSFRLQLCPHFARLSPLRIYFGISSVAEYVATRRNQNMSRNRSGSLNDLDASRGGWDGLTRGGAAALSSPDGSPPSGAGDPPRNRQRYCSEPRGRRGGLTVPHRRRRRVPSGRCTSCSRDAGQSEDALSELGSVADAQAHASANAKADLLCRQEVRAAARADARADNHSAANASATCCQTLCLVLCIQNSASSGFSRWRRQHTCQPR